MPTSLTKDDDFIGQTLSRTPNITIFALNFNSNGSVKCGPNRKKVLCLCSGEEDRLEREELIKIQAYSFKDSHP